jgi:hypothetical protein
MNIKPFLLFCMVLSGCASAPVPEAEKPVRFNISQKVIQGTEFVFCEESGCLLRTQKYLPSPGKSTVRPTAPTRTDKEITERTQ